MTATSLGKFTLSAAATASLALGGVVALNPSLAMAATESGGTGARADRSAAVTPERRVESKKESASDAEPTKTDEKADSTPTSRNDRARGPVKESGDKNEDNKGPGNAIDKPVGEKGRDTKPKTGKDHWGDKDDKGDRGDKGHWGDKDHRGDKGDKDHRGDKGDKGRPGKDRDDCDEDTSTPKPVKPKPVKPKPVTPKPEATKPKPNKPVVTPKPEAPETTDAPKPTPPKADAAKLVVMTPKASSTPTQEVVAAVVTDEQGSTVQVVGDRGVAAETGAEEGVSMNAILGMVGLVSAAGVLTLGRRRK